MFGSGSVRARKVFEVWLRVVRFETKFENINEGVLIVDTGKATAMTRGRDNLSSGQRLMLNVRDAIQRGYVSPRHRTMLGVSLAANASATSTVGTGLANLGLGPRRKAPTPGRDAAACRTTFPAALDRKQPRPR